MLFSCEAFYMKTLPVCHEHSTIIEFVQCRACFELKEREGNNNNTNNKQKKTRKTVYFFFFLSRSSNVFMQRLLTVQCVLSMLIVTSSLSLWWSARRRYDGLSYECAFFISVIHFVWNAKYQRSDVKYIAKSFAKLYFVLRNEKKRHSHTQLHTFLLSFVCANCKFVQSWFVYFAYEPNIQWTLIK